MTLLYASLLMVLFFVLGMYAERLDRLQKEKKRQQEENSMVYPLKTGGRQTPEIMNEELKKELFDALMVSLSYVEDIHATEKAGVETGYKKGVVKRDLQAIKNAINKLEGTKVV